MIKTVADLKRRLAVGTGVTLIGHHVYANNEKRYPDHKYMEVKRTVSRVQSNSFAFQDENGNESWQDWPKRAELKVYDENTFEIDKGWVSCTYRIEE